MKFILSCFNRSKTLFLRLGLVLGFLSITRILFYYANSEHFSSAGIMDFVSGIWFDVVTISILFSVFIVIHLLPLKNERLFKLRESVQTIYILFFALIMLAFNLMDFEYFKFTHKRSTADLFTILGAGNDFAQLATTFLSDFWILIVLLITLTIILFWLYRKVKPVERTLESWKHSAIEMLYIIPLFIILARGGVQLKPIGIIEAAQYTTPENTALILNTPFTILKSLGQQGLEEKHFFSKEKEERYFNPIKTSQPQNLLPDKTNLVIIILESFGNEWAGASKERESFTPYFDSILEKSMTFEYGIANGKKSIEAVPAIIASIPTLMDNPYISSPYSNNKIRSLATILKEKGYSTAFYHGATNGSMRFNSFAAQAGFDKYFGRSEYRNDKHFDRTWGILDEYFNPWTAKQLTKLKQPFFGTLFTLSSHHPYYIPPHFRKKAKKGKHPICASVNYGDYALKRFFQEAKKQPWYSHTLFILVADHTPATSNPKYSSREMMYRIPIAFYDPSGRIPKGKKNRIFQQLDIMPTALDLLNIETNYYSFGNSLFFNQIPEAITYIEGTYQYYFNSRVYQLTNEKARNLMISNVNLQSVPTGQHKQIDWHAKALNRLRAIIQRYNRDLMSNKTATE